MMHLHFFDSEDIISVWNRMNLDNNMEVSESPKHVTWTFLLMAAAPPVSTPQAAVGKSKSKKRKAPQSPAAQPAPSQQAQQQRHTVQLSPDASIAELCKVAINAIQNASASTADTAKDNDHGIITIKSLKAGFPPRPLDLNLNNKTLVEAGLHDKERILVDYSVCDCESDSHDIAAKVQKESKNKTSTSPKTSSSPKAEPPTATNVTTKPKPKAKRKGPSAAAKKKKTAFADSDEEDQEERLYDKEEDGTGTVQPSLSFSSPAATATPVRPRSKRAAAVQATEAFPQVLEAQDAMMQEHAKQSPKKRTRSAAALGSAAAAKVSTAKSKKVTKFTAATTEGRRLQDGSIVAPTAVVRQRQPRSKRKPGASAAGQDDPGVALLGSLQDSGTAGRLMRKNWKQAVNSSYEQNQAVARLAAVANMYSNGNGVTMQRVYRDGRPVPDNVNDDDDKEDNTDYALQVTYPKGIQGRGNYVDTVDYLPQQVLKSVVAAIHPADALRQENLALLSPRVFWSVLYHYHQNNNNNNNDTAAVSVSIHAALQALQPDLDWSFLRRRKEQLSSKARENLRQEEEATATKAGAAANDYEAAAAAIASVEQAMGELTAHDRSQRRSRLRAAALRRLQGSTVTDSEDSWQIVTPDELDEDELTECVNSCTAPEGQSIETLVQTLIQKCQIPNWRVLANANAAALAAQVELPVDTVTAWMVQAQQESIDEITVEICQGNVDAVELLREAARSGTPKDLAAWRWIVDTLHEELVSYQEQQKQLDDQQHQDIKEETIAVPDAETLQLWCDRAQHTLEQIEWLNWYATPICE